MITGIDHATIVTDNLEETRDFFIAALGLEVGYRPDFGVPGVWLYGAGRPILHLAVRPDQRAAAGAIDHFSFGTDDLDAALARLDSIGVKYSRQPFPDGSGAQAFCRDPNGVMIEITQRNHLVASQDQGRAVTPATQTRPEMHTPPGSPASSRR